VTEPDPRTSDEPLPDHLARLAGELHKALPVDDVPDAVLAGARGAWTWRLIDSELAELAEQEQAVLRAGDGAAVTYAADEVFIDVDRERHPVSGTSVVAGQVTAPTGIVAIAAEVASHPPQAVAVEFDGGGAFRVTLPGDAPARLVVRLADGRRVVSSWLV